MSQQGSQGRFRGRGRHSPYSRGGGSYHKGQRNNVGAGGNAKVKVESNVAPEVASAHTEQAALVVGTLGAGASNVGSAFSPGHSQGSEPGPPKLATEAAGDSKGRGMKFSVKARLFVGNLPKDTSQEVVKDLFQRFGEVKEVFVQREKNFGFIRMAYRSDAEYAVASLDGTNFKGREMKVRFAASNSSVKVSNLHPLVSNELLGNSFAQFGEVEKAVVVTDERGKSLGHGIVDFSRKGFAQNAIQRCSEDHFILTTSPMPVLVTEYIRDNDEDGQPDRCIPRTISYRHEHEVPPRFAVPNSVEHAVATQWKMAYVSEKRQREELEQHLRQARNNLVNEMENIREQHQTEMIRQELAHHQQEQLRLVQQLRRRQGQLSLPGQGLMELPNASGGVASLFPGQSGDRPLEEPPSQQPGGETAPANYGGGPPVGGLFPPGGPPMSLLPPPLMGQHSLF